MKARVIAGLFKASWAARRIGLIAEWPFVAFSEWACQKAYRLRAIWGIR